MKKSFYLLVIFLSFLSCKNEKVISTNQTKTIVQTPKFIVDTIKFRKWVNDTVAIIKTEEKDYSSIKIIVPKDSTSLEVYKKYDIRIKVSEKENIKNEDVNFILSLLNYDNNFPKTDFRLEFEIIHFYDIPIIADKLYEKNYEIVAMNVICNKRKYSYKYLKGNLIDTKVFNLN